MTEFRLTYDGPALISHEMSPRDLGPALIAMADLLEASARVIYGDDVKVDVQLKGPFKSGSFNIDFVASVQWLKTVRDFFSGQSAAACANATAILTAVGIVGKGLFSVLRWLRGRPVSSAESLGRDPQGFEQVRIFAGEDAYETRRHVLDLLQDAGVRAALADVVKPLELMGVDIFAIGTGGRLNVIIRDEERVYFASPVESEVLLIDDVRDVAFSVVSCVGIDTKAWRLTDGTSAVSACISDEPFLRAVDVGDVTLLKGDSLVCRARMLLWQTGAGLRLEYDVVQVNRHLRGNRQIPLPLVDSIQTLAVPR